MVLCKSKCTRSPNCRTKWRVVMRMNCENSWVESIPDATSLARILKLVEKHSPNDDPAKIYFRYSDSRILFGYERHVEKIERSNHDTQELEIVLEILPELSLSLQRVIEEATNLGCDFNDIRVGHYTPSYYGCLRVTLSVLKSKMNADQKGGAS